MTDKKTYTVYVGSNNATGKLELSRIEEITARLHEGFTLYTATGYWLGSKEATAVLVIHDSPALVFETIAALKLELQQDAIAYQEAPQLQLA